jgi:ferredoxin
MATECIVCEEWCPTSPKAVYLRPADVVDADGNTRQVRQPYVDPARCVGCGACEYACPVKGSPAVYVTSAGESRSRANRMLLNPPAERVERLPASGDAPGWIKSSETRQFAAVDLWQYVDGDAERYLRAGVRYTLTSTYRYRDAVDAVVDVHRMDSGAAAAAFLESEPSAGSRPVALGDAGRSYGQSVTFREGPLFVRLVAYQETAATETALIALARAIATRLAD